LVMSDDHTASGPWATSSGRVLGGCVAWRRRPWSSPKPAKSARSSTPRPGRHPHREGEVHLGWGGVDEARRTQDLEDLGNLGIGELVGRRRPGASFRHSGPTAPAVDRRPGPPGRHSRHGRAEQGLDHLEALVDHGCWLVSSPRSRPAAAPRAPMLVPGARRALRCRSRRSSRRSIVPRLLELAFGVGTLLAVRGGQPRDRSGVTGPSPLHDVARVQAFSAQQRALGA